MANEESRHWEDYVKGSSDNPNITKSAGAIRMPKSPKSLEKKLLTVQTLKKIDVNNPDREIDVELTNKERTNYALENGLRPVIKHHGKWLYRSVEIDGEGLLHIEYRMSQPEIMGAIGDDETVPLDYVHPKFRAELRSLIKEDIIRGTKSKVNLADVNRYLSRKD